MRRTHAVASLVALASLGLCSAPARAQSIQLHVDGDRVYAGMPFVLSLEASGFDETPEPKVASFTIPGCQITALGMTPSVSSMITIVNGQRSEARNVTFVYRYRIEAARAGNYAIPQLTVSQGVKRAQSERVTFSADDMAATKDMLIRLTVPERPVMVGETFEVTLDWYLRRDVRGQTFSIPLFDQQDWVEVTAPRAGSDEKHLTFTAGARSLELPFQREQQTVDGASYTRYRFTARVTANRAGTLELAPARVQAQLDAGMGRDAFGFPAPRTALFKAQDVPRRLVIRPTPREGRPESFGNAVGTGFSIEVQADRTVVRVGDPIELRVLVRGDHLEGLALPPLGAAMGLAPELFSLPDEAPPGELLSGDSKDPSGRPAGKLFRLVVRLRSPEAREIPPLSFSYFNPESGKYQTVRSLPIAISVKGAAVVGAKEVIAYDGASNGKGGSETAMPAQAAPRNLAAIGADLALSDERQTLRTVLRLGTLAPLLLALYGLGLGIFAWRLWHRRTRGRRAASGELRRARAALERELAAASTQAARAATPRLLAALRALERALGSHAITGAELLDRLETASFDPAANDRPLPAALLEEVRALALGWIDAAARQPVRARSVETATLAIVIGLGLGVGLGHAAASDARLDEARRVYRQALAESDGLRRVAAFTRAAGIYGDLVESYRDRPELLTDWGNAALGAHDLGRAALAYRRALRLDASADRASKNLAWVRGAMPEWLPRAPAGGAMDSLFFWHYALAAAWRHLTAALAFAAALLLLAPWGDSRRWAWLRRGAVLPALVWLAMIGSLLAEHDAARDAIVQSEGVTLRSADSPGAPSVLPQPLPAGAEATILEQRQGWVRVSLGNRTAGWLEASAVAPVL